MQDLQPIAITLCVLFPFVYLTYKHFKDNP